MAFELAQRNANITDIINDIDQIRLHTGNPGSNGTANQVTGGRVRASGACRSGLDGEHGQWLCRSRGSRFRICYGRLGNGLVVFVLGWEQLQSAPGIRHAAMADRVMPSTRHDRRRYDPGFRHQLGLSMTRLNIRPYERMEECV